MKRILSFSMILLLLASCRADPSPTPSPSPSVTLEPLEQTMVTLFLSDDNAVWMEMERVPVEKVDPESLLEALKKEAVIPSDVKINSVQEFGEGDGEVDLSEAFLSALNGTAGERMTMSAISYTFLENLGWRSIYLTCDGESIETGHTIYDTPITLFSLAMVETEEVGYLHKVTDKDLTYDEVELVWVWEEEERAEYEAELKAQGEDFSERSYAIVDLQKEEETLPLQAPKIWLLGESGLTPATLEELREKMEDWEDPPLFQIQTEDNQVTYLIQWDPAQQGV